MNHCRSKLGLEYLYYRFRNLILDKNKLEKIQENRNIYKENTEDLKKLQFILSNIGFFKEDVLELVDEDIEIDRSLEIMAKIFSLSIVYIIISFILFKPIGVLVTFILIAINVYIYKKFNNETLGKLNAMIKLKSILFTAFSISNTELEVYKEEIKEIKEILEDIKPLTKTMRSFKYFSGNRQMDFAETYRNILFLTEARKFIKSAKYFKKYREEILKLYYILGKIDCDISIISVSIAHGARDADFGKEIKGKNLYHPLIENAVPNDLDLEKSILLTGSNASGKSTYLRTIGINAVFALSFGLFFGERFMIKPMIINSAIDISDSIMKNLSYFMAEAKAIEKMINSSDEQLILLDEIFRGTNTVDRISSATATLNYLSNNNHVIAATHDIELTESLKSNYKNMHFEENIEGGDIKFDYKLKSGPVKSRNAINILESLNYPKVVIERAKTMSKELEENR